MTEQERTITVKGTGSIKAKPDWVVLPVTISAKHERYGEVMRLADEALTKLHESISAAGLSAEELRTAEFNISPCFDGVGDENGNFRQVFTGYECRHSLKAEFALEAERLSAVLDALSRCEANPEFSIQFTVEDREALKEELLANAAADARRKAELLCRAAGAALGELRSIDYSCREIHPYSNSRVMLADAGAPVGAMAKMSIAPEDISASDTVTFVWRIESQGD